MISVLIKLDLFQKAKGSVPVICIYSRPFCLETDEMHLLYFLMLYGDLIMVGMHAFLTILMKMEMFCNISRQSKNWLKLS